MSEAALRVAVITPYYKESAAVLQRCLRSLLLPHICLQRDGTVRCRTRCNFMKPRIHRILLRIVILRRLYLSRRKWCS